MYIGRQLIELRNKFIKKYFKFQFYDRYINIV